MPLPASVNTCSRAIRLAMQDAGLLKKGSDPSSEDYAENMGRLNDLANVWQTQGLKLWLNDDVTVPLVANQALYVFGALGTKPLRVIQGYYEDSNDVRRPLIPISRDEYVRLSQVTQTGQLNSYFVDKTRNSMDVYFWLTPDSTAATGAAHLIQQVQQTQVTQLTDLMDFPIEWFMALRWGLAEEISVGQPAQIVQMCQMNAAKYFTVLNDWDVEDPATFFQPDQRIYQQSGNFR